jgi:L-ascorbate metabolism protein UlaG (beta-lactamase superfamily)
MTIKWWFLASVERLVASRRAPVVLLAPVLIALGAVANPALAACPVGVAGSGPLLLPAAYRAVAVPAGHLSITFAGHASFLIETPGGAAVFTDYNGYVHAPKLPDAVTMNLSHDSHYTDFVEPEIKYVLRGWDPAGGVARHNVRIKDARVRNVPTNVTELAGRISNENSIFVVEAAELCVAHLSHLHHVLSKGQVRELGRVDVLLVPIDGMWTMSHQELMHVIGQIEPSLIIPMHYGSDDSVDAFIALASKLYPIKRHSANSLIFSLRTLPRKTEVLFLGEGF